MDFYNSNHSGHNYRNSSPSSSSSGQDYLSYFERATKAMNTTATANNTTNANNGGNHNSTSSTGQYNYYNSATNQNNNSNNDNSILESYLQDIRERYQSWKEEQYRKIHETLSLCIPRKSLMILSCLGAFVTFHYAKSSIRRTKVLSFVKSGNDIRNNGNGLGIATTTTTGGVVGGRRGFGNSPLLNGYNNGVGQHTVGYNNNGGHNVGYNGGPSSTSSLYGMSSSSSGNTGITNNNNLHSHTGVENSHVVGDGMSSSHHTQSNNNALNPSVVRRESVVNNHNSYGHSNAGYNNNNLARGSSSNLARGSSSAGYNNNAAVSGGSLSGGYNNNAAGSGGSLNGGYNNNAAAPGASLSGGYNSDGSGGSSSNGDYYNNNISGGSPTNSGGYYNNDVSGGTSNGGYYNDNAASSSSNGGHYNNNPATGGSSSNVGYYNNNAPGSSSDGNYYNNNAQGGASSANGRYNNNNGAAAGGGRDRGMGSSQNSDITGNNNDPYYHRSSLSSSTSSYQHGVNPIGTHAQAQQLQPATAQQQQQVQQQRVEEMVEFSLAAICDEHCESVGVQLSSADRIFHDYGGKKAFWGEIVSIQGDDEDTIISDIQSALLLSSDNKVLVVDGRGNKKVSIFDMELALMAQENGWSGVIINGCIRDADELEHMIDIGFKALCTNPRMAAKNVMNGNTRRRLESNANDNGNDEKIVSDEKEGEGGEAAQRGTPNSDNNNDNNNENNNDNNNNNKNDKNNDNNNDNNNNNDNDKNDDKNRNNNNNNNNNNNRPVSVRFAGTLYTSGEYVYADKDGILVSSQKLPLLLGGRGVRVSGVGRVGGNVGKTTVSAMNMNGALSYPTSYSSSSNSYQKAKSWIKSLMPFGNKNKNDGNLVVTPQTSSSVAAPLSPLSQSTMTMKTERLSSSSQLGYNPHPPRSPP